VRLEELYRGGAGFRVFLPQVQPGQENP